MSETKIGLPLDNLKLHRQKLLIDIRARPPSVDSWDNIASVIEIASCHVTTLAVQGPLLPVSFRRSARPASPTAEGRPVVAERVLCLPQALGGSLNRRLPA
jgi:hypothetical protein